jgi:hypothetical protein
MSVGLRNYRVDVDLAGRSTGASRSMNWRLQGRPAVFKQTKVDPPMAIAAEDHAIPNVVIVAATNSDDSLASFSNYWNGGQGRWIAAPGGVSVSPVGDGTTGVWSTGLASSYRPDSGTSMAAPIVAGVAALVRERHPNKSANEVVDCIVDGSLHTGGYAYTRSIFPVTDRSPSAWQGAQLVVSAIAAVNCYPIADVCESTPGFRNSWLPTCAALREGLNASTFAGHEVEFQPSHDFGNGFVSPAYAFKRGGVTAGGQIQIGPKDPAKSTLVFSRVIYRHSSGREVGISGPAAYRSGSSGPLVFPSVPASEEVLTDVCSFANVLSGEWRSTRIEIMAMVAPEGGGGGITTPWISRPTKPSDNFSFRVP